MRFFLLSTFLFIFLINSTASKSEVIDLSDIVSNNQIVIIGEKYGNVETAQFFTTFVDNYTKDGNCLRVALELGTDQQEIIKKSVEDLDVLDNLEIRGVYDRIGNLGIITNINKLIRKERCVTIYSVGPPNTVPVAPGPWIAKELDNLAKDEIPILMVAKLKHSLKYFDWDSSGKGTPFLAEKLQQKGYKVGSVLNSWRENYCEEEIIETLSSDDPKVTSYVTNLIYSEVDYLPKKSSTVTDAVNLWRCDINIKKEVEKLIDPKKIKKAIRQGRPEVGMNIEQVVDILGEPYKKDEFEQTEDWHFKCEHEDGFDFDCYKIIFVEGIAAKVISY